MFLRRALRNGPPCFLSGNPMKPIFKFSLVLLAVAPLVALAQPQKTAPITTNNGSQVTIKNAKDGTFSYDDPSGIARWTKNVIITQANENITIRAQEVLANRIRKVANASGQLSIETRDSTIRGKSLFADFNDRKATITQGVVITSHGKRDGTIGELGAELTHKPIRVTCDRVDWDYDIKQATATSNIHIFQGANRGTCNRIVYDERRNIIDLQGDVRFGDDKNRTFVGQEITVYVDESRIAAGRGTTMLFPGGDNFNSPSSPKTARAPKAGRKFAPAPTLPPLDGILAPPPLPAPKATATEEPVPTARPEEPEPTQAPDAMPTVPATN